VNRERRFVLEARAASVVESLVRRLPRRVALALGRGLGRIWADLDPRHVAIAVDNLRHAFPHWDESRRLRTARGVYAHFGQVIFDILWLHRLAPDEIMAFVDVEGVAEARAALAEGRGSAMATGHIGNWELSGVAFGCLFGPSGVVARPLDNPLLDERLVAFRQKSGNAVIYKRQALSQALRMIRAGQGVAFVVDQNVQADEGIFVDFFGRPAASTTAVAALAVRVGCPILTGWAELRPSGRYTLHLGVVRPRAEADRASEVERLTQVLAHLIESWVRTAPEQWLWLHRRWKTRPAAELEAQSARSSDDGRPVAHA
jgi:KDO2-lipid IV(A) lauroyltransferase